MAGIDVADDGLVGEVERRDGVRGEVGDVAAAPVSQHGNAEGPQPDGSAELLPGETIETTYVFEALAPGTFEFTGIGLAEPSRCPICPRIRTRVEHTVVIHDGPPAAPVDAAAAAGRTAPLLAELIGSHDRHG